MRRAKDDLAASRLLHEQAQFAEAAGRLIEFLWTASADPLNHSLGRDVTCNLHYLHQEPFTRIESLQPAKDQVVYDRRDRGKRSWADLPCGALAEQFTALSKTPDHGGDVERRSSRAVL